MNPIEIRQAMHEYLKLNYPYVIEKHKFKHNSGFTFTYPDLPGIYVDAPTIRQGLYKLHQAKIEWFYYALNNDIEIPQPKKG